MQPRQPRLLRRAPAGLFVVAAALAVAAGAPMPAAASPTSGGFSSYNPPQLADLFPDAAGLRRLIDRFDGVHREMATSRADFSRAVQQALAGLTRSHGRTGARRCRRLAEPFARAQRFGERFLRQGQQMLRTYDFLTRLGAMGETVGLTPDYRSKAYRARKVYRSLRSDYREMTYIFYEQLIPELTYAGCSPETLVALAAKQPTSKTAPRTAPASALRTIPPHPRKAPSGPPPRPATMISFYVDNTLCREPLTVVVDGARLGEVPARRRLGFRSRSGPHELCLLHRSTKQTCGATGTLRRSYLHEGWTVQLRCPK